MINWDILEAPVRRDGIGEPEPGELVPILPAEKPAAVVDFPAMARSIKAELDHYRPEFERLVSEAKALEIVDAATNSDAASMVLILKKLDKKLKEAFKSRTGEMQAVLDEGKAALRALTSAIEAAKKELESKLVRHDKLQEQKRREAEMVAVRARAELQKQLDAEAKKGGFEAITVPEMVVPEPTRKIVTDQGSVTYRTVQKWRVIAPELIPRVYLVPDDKGISQAQKAGLLIPGIEYYDEKTIVRRS